MGPQPPNDQEPSTQPQGESQEVSPQPALEQQTLDTGTAQADAVDQSQQSASGDAASFGSVQPPVVQTPAAPMPVAKKSPAMVIVIIVASVLVVALAVTLVWALSSRNAPNGDGDSRQADVPVVITEADYEQASSAIADLKLAYNIIYPKTDDLPNMIRSYNSAYDDKKVESLKSLFADYKQKSDAFLKLNALKDDSIKQQYDDFLKQNEKFVSFIEGFIDTVPALKGTESCASADLSSYTDETALTVHDKAYAPCNAAVDGMIKSKNETISKYGEAMKVLFDKLRSLNEDIQNSALAHDSDGVSKARSTLMKIDAAAETKPADEALAKGVVDATELGDQLKALQDALDAKVS